MVSTRTTTGSIGILANHAPLMAILEPTTLGSIALSRRSVEYAQSEGYLQVVDNSALVLVEEAVEPGQVDTAAIEAQLKEAREALDAPRRTRRRSAAPSAT